jgi:hypothetical protein
MPTGMPNFSTSIAPAKPLKPKGSQSFPSIARSKNCWGMRKNGGRQWQAKGQETTVNVYDYLSIADGKAIPYGIYDLMQNSGFESARDRP